MLALQVMSTTDMCTARLFARTTGYEHYCHVYSQVTNPYGYEPGYEHHCHGYSQVTNPSDRRGYEHYCHV